MADSRQPVEVAFVIAALVIGGAERQLLYLLRGLDRTRYRPRLYAFADGPWRERFEALDVPLEIIDWRRGRPRVLLELCRHLRRHPAGLVHTYGHSANMIGRLAALAAGAPAVIVSERSAPFIKSRATRLIDRLLAPFTAGLIANSAHAARYWSEHRLIGEGRAWAVYNGIEAERYTVSGGSAEGCRLVTVGDMRREKNHSLLFEALALVVAERPEVRLTIAGDGSLRGELEAQAARLGITENLHLPGFVDDVPGLFGASDIYVHTAHYEGLPNAVMEAMVCALPCVVTAIDGCRELVGDGDNGVVVEPGSPRALAGALLRLLEDDELRRRMGARGRARIEREFSIERMVERTETLYHRALSVRRRGVE